MRLVNHKSEARYLQRRLLLSVLSGFFCLITVPVPAQSEPANAGGARAPSAESDAPSLQNGCVRNTQIKRVSFATNAQGLLELRGGDKVVIRFARPCAGIRNEGYVHKPTNGLFCQGDMLRVINYGTVCVVDELRPWVEQDAAP